MQKAACVCASRLLLFIYLENPRGLSEFLSLSEICPRLEWFLRSEWISTMLEWNLPSQVKQFQADKYMAKFMTPWYNKLPQNCYFFQRTGKTTARCFAFRESKWKNAAEKMTRRIWCWQKLNLSLKWQHFERKTHNFRDFSMSNRVDVVHF